ncbi:MAG TPA: 2-oxoacid:acceptor oxidoreductase subunit alpha [Tepidisphaeraceae bacterium]|jgi:2-oxoglutarate ferredoxin oxidoreductase subunit alpha|nr:2-oxoacid:acceptor oxidoreductase subunit alpha [Tepidisphaeraceae bacterium]
MSLTLEESSQSANGRRKPVTTLPSVTVRFCGDSGDGMQLAGTQFTDTSALIGNDISTLPDFPAEIRAPAGTLAGVSGFQVHFSSTDIFTPGDDVDALVAMNPAALKTNLKSVKSGGIVIVNEDAFEAGDLKKAGYAANPIEDNSLQAYRLIKVPINKLTSAAAKETGLGAKDIDRCKNMFALGLCYWLYGRPLGPTLTHIDQKFGEKKPVVAAANALALKAGYHFGETAELFHEQYEVPKAKLPAGTYRKITGNEATALGMIAAGQLANKQVIYCSYPITPASDILHTLSSAKNFNVMTFQAEDEIAAVGAAIGVSFGGSLGVTGTSGPGIALKSEAIGLAVMTELPLVIINVQRGGPSTGLPTKTEQSDLLQVLYGRNGECPVPVIASSGPADCFHAIIEAFAIAVKYMTPVVFLSDGYVANGAEPWLIPDVSKLAKIEVKHPTEKNDPKGYMPYKRDEKLARPWAIPGTPGLEHRIGGLEKQDVTGAVSYDGVNHEKMSRIRAAKVAGITPAGDDMIWTGAETGDVLLVGWGGTFGAIKAATLELQQQGIKASACHIRYLNPLPRLLGTKLKQFKHVLIPELNLGQLRMLLRNRYLVDAKGLNKVKGQPFAIHEIVDGAKALLAGRVGLYEVKSAHDDILVLENELSGA